MFAWHTPRSFGGDKIKIAPTIKNMKLEFIYVKFLCLDNDIKIRDSYYYIFLSFHPKFYCFR